MFNMLTFLSNILLYNNPKPSLCHTTWQRQTHRCTHRMFSLYSWRGTYKENLAWSSGNCQLNKILVIIKIPVPPTWTCYSTISSFFFLNICVTPRYSMVIHGGAAVILLAFVCERKHTQITIFCWTLWKMRKIKKRSKQAVAELG